MGLWETLNLDLNLHRAITLVGGGGKTTTMYTLAHEAREAGRTVIVTTSTHIMPHPRLFLTDDPDPAHLSRCIQRHGILTLGTMARADKLCGTGEIGMCKTVADVVIIEGDGAKLKPLKAPADHEPVIPPETDAVVALAGMDAVGKLIRETCHRPERVCALLDKPETAIVGPEDLIAILSSPMGGRKSVAAHMAYRCALNKADCNPEAARIVAQGLKARGIFAAITSFQEEERGGACWF